MKTVTRSDEMAKELGAGWEVVEQDCAPYFTQVKTTEPPSITVTIYSGSFWAQGPEAVMLEDTMGTSASESLSKYRAGVSELYQDARKQVAKLVTTNKKPMFPEISALDYLNVALSQQGTAIARDLGEGWTSASWRAIHKDLGLAVGLMCDKFYVEAEEGKAQSQSFNTAIASLINRHSKVKQACNEYAYPVRQVLEELRKNWPGEHWRLARSEPVTLQAGDTFIVYDGDSDYYARSSKYLTASYSTASIAYTKILETTKMAEATVTEAAGPALTKGEQKKLLRSAWKDLRERTDWTVNYSTEQGEVLTSAPVSLGEDQYVFEFVPKWETNVRFRRQHSKKYAATAHYGWWAVRPLKAKLASTKLAQHPKRTALLAYAGALETKSTGIKTDGALTLVDAYNE